MGVYVCNSVHVKIRGQLAGINSITWVLETECRSSGLEASTIMLSNTASPQSILESAQKQLSHKALAYHAKALGLT